MAMQLANPGPSRSPFASRAFVLAAAATSAIAAFAWADSPVDKIKAEAARAEITVQPLRGNVTAVMGSGGNITILSSPEGRLMVDAGITISRPRLEPALNRISPNPINISSILTGTSITPTAMSGFMPWTLRSSRTRTP